MFVEPKKKKCTLVFCVVSIQYRIVERPQVGTSLDGMPMNTIHYTRWITLYKSIVTECTKCTKLEILG